MEMTRINCGLTHNNIESHSKIGNDIPHTCDISDEPCHYDSVWHKTLIAGSKQKDNKWSVDRKENIDQTDKKKVDIKDCEFESDYESDTYEDEMIRKEPNVEGLTLSDYLHVTDDTSISLKDNLDEKCLEHFAINCNEKKSNKSSSISEKQLQAYLNVNSNTESISGMSLDHYLGTTSDANQTQETSFKLNKNLASYQPRSFEVPGPEGMKSNTKFMLLLPITTNLPGKAMPLPRHKNKHRNVKLNCHPYFAQHDTFSSQLYTEKPKLKPQHLSDLNSQVVHNKSDRHIDCKDKRKAISGPHIDHTSTSKPPLPKLLGSSASSIYVGILKDSGGKAHEKQLPPL